MHKLRSTTLTVFFIVPLLFLAPFFALLFNAVPVADDYCKGSLFSSQDGVFQSSPWEFIWKEYWSWSSRWLSILLQSFIIPRVGLTWTYGLALALIALLIILALMTFFRQMIQASVREAALLAIMFFAAWLASVPNPGESFYWLTSGIEYQFSLAVILILVTTLLNDRLTETKWTALLMLCAVAIPALHELAGIFLWSLLVASIALRVTMKLTIQRWLWVLAVVTVSLTVVILSPGPRARAAIAGAQLWDFAGVARYIGLTLFELSDWVSSPVMLLALLWVLLFQPRRLTDSVARVADHFLLMFCLFGTLILPVLLVLVQMASGTSMPDRALGWMQFLFWLFLICSAVHAIPIMSPSNNRFAARCLVSIMLIVSLFGTQRYISAITDLTRRSGPWRQELLSMLSEPPTLWSSSRLPHQPTLYSYRAIKVQLEEMLGEPPTLWSSSRLPHQPTLYSHLLTLDQIQDNAAWWVNRCAAKYVQYQKDSSTHSNK